MARLAVDSDLYEALGAHLNARAEQIGFFLAEWQSKERLFVLRNWWAVPPEGLEHQSDFHVSLTEDVRAEAIKWAWDSGTCLVEAHSHGFWGSAKFSPSDLWGFEDWVPHLWWRLRGRPYAAIVTAGDTFDAIAWIDAPNAVEQIESLDIKGSDPILPTGRTLLEGTDYEELGDGLEGAKVDD